MWAVAEEKGGGEMMRSSAKERKQQRDAWRWDESQRIAYMQVNPKDPSSKCFQAYEKYKQAKTVTEFFQLGGTWGHLDWDRERGFVVERPEGNGAVTWGWAQLPPGTSKSMERKRFFARQEAHRKYHEHAEAFHAEREAREHNISPRRWGSAFSKAEIRC